MTSPPLPAAPSLRLYTAPASMFGMKVEIALREKALAFERISVPFSIADGYTPKHPDVLRINPKGQVPVLVHGDLQLFDSTQIFEYLEDLAPEPPLWPRGIGERASARLAEHQSDEVYFPHVIRLMSLQQDLGSAAAVAAIEGARAYCLEQERRLAGLPFIAAAFSYADIAFYMAQLFADRMGAPLTAAMPRLRAWRDRITERPAVRRTLAAFLLFLHEHARPIPIHLYGALAEALGGT